MTDAFNPYREWLGIEGTNSRPSAHQLLGLPSGETNEQRIQQAAERATVKVRSFRPGEHAADWARILDEIQAAKKYLLEVRPGTAAAQSEAASTAAANPAANGRGTAAGESGIRKLLGKPGGASAPRPAAPVQEAAPRMQMETTPSNARDLLPPRPAASNERPMNPAPAVSNPAPAVSNPAPAVTNPAPLAANPGLLPPQPTAAPVNPAPFAAQAVLPTAVPSAYTAEVATPVWNPAPTMPAAAWNAPTAMPPPAAQPWGMAAADPMSAAPGYGYPPASNPMNPMAPASYGGPLNYAPPPAAPPMATTAMAMPQAPYAAPAAMDPMAPAYNPATAYSAAAGYGGLAPYGGAPSPGPYGGPMSAAPAYAAPAYAAPDPMQAMPLSAAPFSSMVGGAPPLATGIPEPAYAYGPTLQPAADSGAGAYSTAYSLGIGPPPSATPVATAMMPAQVSPLPMATALPMAANPMSASPMTANPMAAVPMTAAPVGVAAAAGSSAPMALPAQQQPGESQVSIRSTRSRGGNNSLMLAGVGGGALLLLVAVAMVVFNQPKPDAVAANSNQQRSPVYNSGEKKPTKPSTPVRNDSSDDSSAEKKPSIPPARIPEPEMSKPEPMPEPMKPTVPPPEPAKPEPTKPEPTKPEPEPAKPAKEPVKPTKEQLEELSKLLTAARQALREQKFDEAMSKLAKADELPKLEEQAVVVDRLQQLAKHAKDYRTAFEQGKQKLAVGQMLKVTASTQPEIVELDAEKITISNKGEKRTYEFATLPQGLFFAIADSSFEPGDVQQKVQRGAYAIALASDAKEAEKGKALWEEAIQSGAPLTLLLPVVNDKYDTARLEAVAMVDVKPEPPPETPTTSPPGAKGRPGSATALPLLKKARDEISGHQFSEAQAVLNQAKPLLANDEQEAKHTRLTLLLNYTKQFKDAIDRTLARLDGGNTFEVGKTVVSVVEIKPREIIVRVNGTNRTYQRNELPIGMAVALGDMSLQKDTPEAKLVRGAYVVASSSKPDEIEKAKTWWQEAGSSVDVKSLLPVITDTYTK